MFGQFSEQMKKSSQPVNELLAANVKAIETVTKQQTQFFSGLVEDSVKLMQTVAQQTEIQGVIAAQSVYAESVRERLTSNSKVTYNTVSSVSKQYTDALQSGIATATEAAKEEIKTVVAKAPVVKPAPAVKADAAVKATPTKKATPAKKATPQKKATAKAAATSTTTAKAVAKPAPKTAEKPIAKLSADEVKAPAKIKTTDVKATDVKATPAKQSEVETKA